MLKKEFIQKLGFDVTDYRNCYSVAVDSKSCATYSIEKLRYQPVEDLKHFYNQLILYWLFGLGTFTNYDWCPSITDLDTLPTEYICVSKTLVTEYREKYLTPEPASMLLVNYNVDYTRECYRIYCKVRDNLDCVKQWFVLSGANDSEMCQIYHDVTTRYAELHRLFDTDLSHYNGVIPNHVVGDDRDYCLKLQSVADGYMTLEDILK